MNYKYVNSVKVKASKKIYQYRGNFVTGGDFTYCRLIAPLLRDKRIY